ncbi:hypothetical protein GWI33_012431 [Rhynchophorus ferrugineus]|uniref:Uncharacterized protein n=1 Tax=Rhynchophorus ferrugineus TaxID=354439 RepID=A0A834MCH7_RHYFE|nr:hypothetical protein GWI33_012431 [Rhynchophorus ferrugineus]
MRCLHEVGSDNNKVFYMFIGLKWKPFNVSPGGSLRGSFDVDRHAPNPIRRMQEPLALRQKTHTVIIPKED